ncbi:MAG: macro domain-containing protein [Chloroflexi bacterium]|nr:macro domain-containing protein [Chloroflexota bacterium]
MQKLVLVDPNPAVCAAWKHTFKDLPNVEIVNDIFQNLEAFDCMVSAANSFGLMDGGVDAAIIRFFGSALMERVQRRIMNEYFGEQPVGTSMIVETHHPDHPFIAHTPTMRVPMRIKRTDYVYNAMFAMLRAVHHHNQSKHPQRIDIVACPGLGTATGGMMPPEAARQMALAYQNYLTPPQTIDWRFASRRQSEIIFGGDFDYDLPDS